MSAVDVRRWTRPELEHAVKEAGRQRAAVLDLHGNGEGICVECLEPYPCPTASALGVASPEASGVRS